MMLGIRFGSAPLGTDRLLSVGGARFLPSDIASLINPVMLLEFQAMQGAVSSVRRPTTFGTYAFGTLPYKTMIVRDAYRYSDKDYASGPADSPANTHYEARLAPVSIDEAVPLDPAAERRSTLSVGQISLVNRDRLFDSLPDTHGIDQQPVTLKLLRSRAHKLSQAVTLWSGLGYDWLAQQDNLDITVTDLAYQVTGSLLATYTGAGGADGSSDLKNKPIPQVYGRVRNVEPVLINQAQQIYQIHDRQISNLFAVRVRGASITIAGTQPTYAALSAATVAAGTVQYCSTPTGSFFRLGSNADGIVNCDVDGDAAGGFVSTVPEIMLRILSRFMSTDMVDSTGFTSLAVNYPGVAGIAFTGQTSIAAALDLLAKSCLLWWGDNNEGKLSLGEVNLPANDQGILIDENSLRALPSPQKLPGSVAPCIWQAIVSYRQNWSQLAESDVASSVLQDPSWTWLSAPNLQTRDVHAERIMRHASAVNYGADVPHVTYFDSEADALSIAARLTALFDVGRTLWQVPVDFSGYAVRRGDTVLVKTRQAPLAKGKPLVVVGRSMRGNEVDLLAFG